MASHEIVRGANGGSRFMDSGAIEARVDESQGGVLANLAREEAEIRASLVLARQFPRNEGKALQRIISTVETKEFAEVAIWTMPRGKETITGPSVHLAREMAKLWGNIQYGFRVVSMSEEEVHICGYAWDAETNTRVTHEMRFPRLIFRRKDGWRPPNSDELLELVNRNGAKAERNAVFKVLPRDVVATAEARARETIDQDCREELSTAAKRKAAVQKVEKAFRDLGVHRSVLEAHLGHPLEEITAEENRDLRLIRTAIVEEGRSARSFFDFDAAEKSGGKENEDAPKRKLSMADLKKGEQPNETRPRERQERTSEPEEEPVPEEPAEEEAHPESEPEEAPPKKRAAAPKSNGKTPAEIEGYQEKAHAFVEFRKAARKIVKRDDELIAFTRDALEDLGFARHDIDFGGQICHLSAADVEMVLSMLNERVNG